MHTFLFMDTFKVSDWVNTFNIVHFSFGFSVDCPIWPFLRCSADVAVKVDVYLCVFL